MILASIIVPLFSFASVVGVGYASGWYFQETEPEANLEALIDVKGLASLGTITFYENEEYEEHRLVFDTFESGNLSFYPALDWTYENYRVTSENDHDFIATWTVDFPTSPAGTIQMKDYIMFSGINDQQLGEIGLNNGVCSYSIKNYLPSTSNSVSFSTTPKFQWIEGKRPEEVEEYNAVIDAIKDLQTSETDKITITLTISYEEN